MSGVTIDGVSGRPLAGVALALTGSVAKVSVATISDSKGRFVFTDLPSSDGYSLSATKAGYVSGPAWRRSALVSGARLSLADGEWLSDLVVDLWRLGSISGVVIDERGDPLVDVPVQALVRVREGGTTHWAGGPVVRTDDRGVYRLGGLQAGAYVINVPNVQATVPASVPLGNLSGLSADDLRARGMTAPQVASLDLDDARLLVGRYATSAGPGRRAQAYPQLFYPGARSLADAAPIDLGHGESRHGVDFALTAVPTVRLSGRVIGPPEMVAGLALRLLPAGSESLGPGSEQATTIAEPNGTFVFESVPSGRYALVAATSASYLTRRDGSTATLPETPARRAPHRVMLISAHAVTTTGTEPGHEIHSSEQRVLVGSEDVSDLMVVLERGATVRGRMIRDDGGAVPVPRSVWMSPAAGDPALGRFEGRVEPGGERSVAFSIQGMRRGEYALTATAGLLRVKSITAGGEDYTDRPFDMVPDAHLADIVVTFTAQTTTLSGALRDARGRVPQDAAVIVFPLDSTQWTRYGLSPSRIESRVAFGREGYRFTNVPAGQYHVVAVDPQLREAWRDPRFLEAAAPLADRVTLEWGASTVRHLTVQQVVVR